jgi:hypothetical protein
VKLFVWIYICLIASANIFAYVVVLAADRNQCSVHQFKAIAYTHHDPTERYLKTMSWLKKNGPNCSQQELVHLYNNLSNYLGTSLTQEYSLLIEQWYWEKEKTGEKK